MKPVPVIHTSNNGWKGAAVSALLLAAVLYFCYFLNHFQYLPGTDAYFYALQAQSLLETGQLKVPDKGFIYYGMASLAWLGLSIETSFRIVLSLVFTLEVSLLWLYASRLRGEIRILAALAIALAAPFIAFHTIEFPRLSLGLAMVPLWFHLASGRRALGHPLLWLVLLGSALLHTLTAALAVLFAAALLITSWWQNRRGQSRWSLKMASLALLGVGVFGALIWQFWPGIATRLSSLSLGTPGLFSLLTDAGIPLDIKGTLLFFWGALSLMSIRYMAHSRSPFRYLPLAVLALSLWPNHEGGLFGVGGRLALAALFITLPMMFTILNEQYPGDMSASKPVGQARRFGIAALAVTLLLGFPLRLNQMDELLLGNDYKQYAKVVSALRGREVPMLIAHRGLDFYYTFKLRRDAFHFDPEAGWDKSEIWRVAVQVTPEEMAYYSPPECGWGETAELIQATSLLLVREDCWQRFRANISADDNPDLYLVVWQNMDNPSQPRPAFLREKYRHREPGTFPALPSSEI